MSSYPTVARSEQGVDIRFAPEPASARTVHIDIVLDYNWERAIIGLEILNLKHAAGPRCLDMLTADSPEVEHAYDDEVDAFSLWLSAEDSMDQEEVLGTLMLDSEGRIFGIKVGSEISSPSVGTH